jgi:hypothetical protein
MGALTPEERRRVFLSRQEKIREQMAWPSAPIAAAPLHPLRRPLSAVLKAAVIVALLGSSWLAYYMFEFHVPASIAEALPRL